MPRKRLLASACLASLLSALPRRPRERCSSVQASAVADVGWSDVTATTAVFSRLLADLGYQPETTLLAVPVTFAEMKAGNIDVFSVTGCRRRPAA